MSILSMFYRWALEEGHAQAEPFIYKTARALFHGTGREVRVNLAVRRTPKPHVTIKCLEPDFTQLFLNGLRGLTLDGAVDTGYRGRELARNAAVGELALATGLRLQEFACLLACEIPALPSRPTLVPIPFPVPARVTKGRKFRVTWISYNALVQSISTLSWTALRLLTARHGARRDGGVIRCWSPPQTHAAAGLTASVGRGTRSPRTSDAGWSPLWAVRACWR